MCTHYERCQCIQFYDGVELWTVTSTPSPVDIRSTESIFLARKIAEFEEGRERVNPLLHTRSRRSGFYQIIVWDRARYSALIFGTDLSTTRVSSSQSDSRTIRTKIIWSSHRSTSIPSGPSRVWIRSAVVDPKASRPYIQTIREIHLWEQAVDPRTRIPFDDVESKKTAESSDKITLMEPSLTVLGKLYFRYHSFLSVATWSVSFARRRQWSKNTEGSLRFHWILARSDRASAWCISSGTSCVQRQSRTRFCPMSIRRTSNIIPQRSVQIHKDDDFDWRQQHIITTQKTLILISLSLQRNVRRASVRIVSR